MDVADMIEVDCATAEVLGGRMVCTAPGFAAQSECQLLELIGESTPATPSAAGTA